jgi:membrane protein
MNTIWDVRDPKHASAWWYVRTYLVSFAGILALGFLLATSLVVSAALAAVLDGRALRPRVAKGM